MYGCIGYLWQISPLPILVADLRQKKIFEQFFRISSTQHKSGYGIGLALVKYAMKAHSGGVKVESELGKGSTFVISLPKDKC